MTTATIEKPVARRNLTIAKAMAEALAQEMRRDENVFVMGEDIGVMGSVYDTTLGLIEEFGQDRVRDTPISETGFVSAAVGAAALGMRPVVELMFVDFIGVCLNAVYNLAAKQAYFSGGTTKCPMVLMASVGGGYSDGGQHSQTLYALFAHLPGLKVVIPSNAYDAKGLMLSAIRDDNPVIFLFHKAIQGLGWLAPLSGAVRDVPEEDYCVPIGKAKIVREGKDVTIVGFGLGVHHAEDAAERLSERGVFCEIVDLRTLAPIDTETLAASLRKTGRLVVVDDDYSRCGVAAEIITLANELAWDGLRAAPARVAHPDVPIPFARDLERALLPNADKIEAAVVKMMEL
ncbi:MAG: alpha-ketoacid dehydrogenase subunit beta [Parasphingopyxis sp.]|uniref:alpha-ketoacid dehydrogenase subunit beta n=1 Tax=Parasphingopyxis sp. TaxID=1920299 RepID=UPI0032EBE60E